MLTALLFSFMIHAHADALSWNYESFAAAGEGAPSFTFVGASTKFGLVTTNFEGRARRGELSWSMKQGKIADLKAVIPVAGLDTDNEDRDTKMREKCLGVQEHPEIKVESLTELDTELEKQTLKVRLMARGKSVEIPLEVTRTSAKAFTGKGSFKFRELGIPDPSIAIAKLGDEFAIRVRVVFP